MRSISRSPYKEPLRQELFLNLSFIVYIFARVLALKVLNLDYLNDSCKGHTEVCGQQFAAGCNISDEPDVAETVVAKRTNVFLECQVEI